MVLINKNKKTVTEIIFEKKSTNIFVEGEFKQRDIIKCYLNVTKNTDADTQCDNNYILISFDNYSMPLEQSTQKESSIGIAILNPIDKHSDRVGMTLALTKAMKSSSLDKQTRTEIWKRFNGMF